MAQALYDNFHVRVTRNAVTGKGHRLGLIDERSAGQIVNLSKVRQSEAYHQRRKAKPKPVEKKTVVRLVKSVSEESFEPRIVDTSPLHLTILQLTDETCKYECSGTSEPQHFTFCGRPTFSSTPYCAAHARICFLPANFKRARA